MNSEMVIKSKREIIVDAIEAGGATMESLILAADCKYESVMSNFSMLRLMGKCPVKDVETEIDGKKVLTYRFVTFQEWEDMKAEKAANASSRKPVVVKSLAQRLIAAEKRVERCDTAAVAAQKRADEGNNDELLDLRAQKAEIELRIAQIEFDLVSALVESNKEAKVEYEALTVCPEPAGNTDAQPKTTSSDSGTDDDENIDFE